MKIKLTNEKKTVLHAVLAHLMKSPERSNPKYNYAIIRNAGLLEAEAKAIQKTNTETLADYEKERIALAEKHAKKDAAGKAILIENGTKYDIPDLAAFNVEFDALKAKHKEALDKAKAFMSTAEESVVYPIHFDTLPTLELSVMEVLMPVITGEPKE